MIGRVVRWVVPMGIALTGVALLATRPGVWLGYAFIAAGLVTAVWSTFTRLSLESEAERERARRRPAPPRRDHWPHHSH